VRPQPANAPSRACARDLQEIAAIIREALHLSSSPRKPANEPVEKPPNRDSREVFSGHLALPKHEIVDCSAFYEVTFFRISPKNLRGDFFYSLNDLGQRWL